MRHEDYAARSLAGIPAGVGLGLLLWLAILGACLWL